MAHFYEEGALGEGRASHRRNLKDVVVLNNQGLESIDHDFLHLGLVSQFFHYLINNQQSGSSKNLNSPLIN